MELPPHLYSFHLFTATITFFSPSILLFQSLICFNLLLILLSLLYSVQIHYICSPPLSSTVVITMSSSLQQPKPKQPTPKTRELCTRTSVSTNNLRRSSHYATSSASSSASPWDTMSRVSKRISN